MRLRLGSRTLAAGVLAAALALARARLEGGGGRAARALADAQLCETDADCTADDRKPVCTKDGTCSWLVDNDACWEESPCAPGDDKLCRRSKHCSGSATCRRSRALRYRTCQCPYNQVWRDLDGEVVCNSDGDDDDEDGSDWRDGEANMGCGCAPGSARESNGWCVPVCCEGQLRARQGSPCPRVCGQTINCASGESIWDGGEADGATCGCPRARPVFDPSTNRCVAEEEDCSGRADPQCRAPLVWHRFMPCPQFCGQEDQVCAAEARSGCGCPAGLPFYDVEAAGCVASREDCSGGGGSGGGSGGGGGEGENCAAPFVVHDVKPCQQECGEEEIICTQVAEPGCACPSNAPMLDKASGTCVVTCPGAGGTCTGGRLFFAESKPCEQVCGQEPTFCGPLEPGCACPEGLFWSPVSEQCVLPTRCDIR